MKVCGSEVQMPKGVYVRKCIPTSTLFWRRVHKTDKCWLWQGPLNRKGYGEAFYQGSNRLAHRVAWALTHGDMPTLCVLHKCDNPICVRPDHLFLGTRADNNRDMATKNRHGLSKLTLAQVREIRTFRGQEPLIKTAERYHVSFSLISHIQTGRARCAVN